VTPAVPAEIVDAIERNCRLSFHGVFARDFDYRKMAEEFVSEARCGEQIELLQRMLPIDLRGRRLLEIGSGYGMSVATCRRRFGIEAFGVEPGEQFHGTYATSLEILGSLGLPAAAIVQGSGESLPFDDGDFDVVYSSNVLEHVQDPARVVAEAIRVLRPGGFLCFVVPNYGSWWEGHYGVLFPPHCPEWVFKILVRLLGRDASFVDTLHFLTYGGLRRLLAPHQEQLRVLTFGQEIWVERLRSLDFSEWASLGALKRLVRWVHRAGLVRPVIWIGQRLHWETPFILVAEKVGGGDARSA